MTVILNGEKLEVFSLISGMGHRHPLLPLLCTIVLEVLVNAMRQKKEIEGIQIGLKENLLLIDVIRNLCTCNGK